MSGQTPEDIARWAERQDEKKPNGAAAHLSPEQKQLIRTAYLATGGSITYTEMGARCAAMPEIGRPVNRETIAVCMKGPEYEALRKHFDTEIKAGAIEQLKSFIIPATKSWGRAIEVGGEKGDHKPAKDLLMHTGTIEPLDEDGRARGPLVLIAIAPERRALAAAGEDPEDVPRWTDGTRTYSEHDVTALRHNDLIIQVGAGPGDVKIGLLDAGAHREGRARPRDRVARSARRAAQLTDPAIILFRRSRISAQRRSSDPVRQMSETGSG